MEDNREVLSFYDAGAEIGRLERGLGKVEYWRTKEILSPFVGGQKVIYDIGGGVGVYSSWLASMGHKVHLLELSPTAVKYACTHQNPESPFAAQVGDARELPYPSESADVVLLMGPLYHLQQKQERQSVLSEAFRVLKKGGILAVAGISRASSTTWALSVYGEKNHFIDDEVYFSMLEEELQSGRHNRPEKYPGFIAQAYFHTPEELDSEIREAGFSRTQPWAVEGILWFTPHLEEKWNDPDSRNRLLRIAHMTEQEPSLMGMSPHFLITAEKSESP